jgi:hypothetical protein
MQMFTTVLLFSHYLIVLCNPVQVQIMGNKYSLYVEELATYEEATQICANENSTLASVTSKELNNQLTKVMQVNVLTYWYKGQGPIDGHNGVWSYWIGLHKVQKQWRNSDGSIASYFNWLQNSIGFEPSGDGNCVEVYLDYGVIPFWNDKDCNEQRPFVCEHNQPEVKVNNISNDDVTNSTTYTNNTLYANNTNYTNHNRALNRKLGIITVNDENIFALLLVIAAMLALITFLLVMILIVLCVKRCS